MNSPQVRPFVDTIPLFVALMISLPLGALADEIAQDDIDRAALFTGCAPMISTVSVQRHDTDIDLTTKTVEAAVDSRLRSARLYDSTPTDSAGIQALRVSSMVVGSSFSVDIDLIRWVPDTGNGHSGLVPVWQASTTGTHGGSGQYVLGVVSEHLDAFINKYLKINEISCDIGLKGTLRNRPPPEPDLPTAPDQEDNSKRDFMFP